MIQTLGLFSELSGLFWKIITLAGVLSKSIKISTKLSHHNLFFKQMQDSFSHSQIQMSKFRNKSSAYLLQKEMGGKKSLLFAFLLFKVKAAWYQPHLNMGLGVEKTITIKRETDFKNKVHIFLLFRAVEFQSHL